MKYKSNQQVGFTGVETLIVIVIAIFVGIAGYFVYKNYHKPITVKQSASVASVNSKPNPYADWKTYCPSLGSLCVDYPMSWIISQATSPGVQSISITSPSKDTAVVYYPEGSISGSGSKAMVNIVAVGQTAVTSLEVVSEITHWLNPINGVAYTAGVFLEPSANNTTPNNQPIAPGVSYTSNDEPNTYGFEYPASSQYTDELYIVDNPSKNIGVNSFTTTQDAQLWLNSPEVKTATRIIDSVKAKA